MHILQDIAHTHHIAVIVACTHRDLACEADAVIAGEDRNIGKGVCDDIAVQRDGAQWHFVSNIEAYQGLESGEYSMVCRIPENFSRDIASCYGSTPERACMIVTYNQSANVVASYLG